MFNPIHLPRPRTRDALRADHAAGAARDQAKAQAALTAVDDLRHQLALITGWRLTATPHPDDMLAAAHKATLTADTDTTSNRTA